MTHLNLITFSYFYSKQNLKSIDEFNSICSRIKTKEFQSLDRLLKLIPYLKFYENSKKIQIWDQVQKQIQESLDKKDLFSFPGDENYPINFLNLEDPPFFLHIKGNPVWKNSYGFAVVGSREPSFLTERWCEQELSFLFEKLPFFIVSGGARGIDQMAHRIALQRHRSTVALIPSGLNALYPENFSNWVSTIIEHQGCVMSEFLPNTKMQKHFFQQRNRLIAGLSLGTLVLEAKSKSGSLLTARQTLQQNKPLFVLPSHPLDEANKGGLDLFIEGATPIRDAQDLIICLSSEIQTMKYRHSHLVSQVDLNH